MVGEIENGAYWRTSDRVLWGALLFMNHTVCLLLSFQRQVLRLGLMPKFGRRNALTERKERRFRRTSSDLILNLPQIT